MTYNSVFTCKLNFEAKQKSYTEVILDRIAEIADKQPACIKNENYKT